MKISGNPACTCEKKIFLGGFFASPPRSEKKNPRKNPEENKKKRITQNTKLQPCSLPSRRLSSTQQYEILLFPSFFFNAHSPYPNPIFPPPNRTLHHRPNLPCVRNDPHLIWVMSGSGGVAYISKPRKNGMWFALPPFQRSYQRYTVSREGFVFQVNF